MKPSLALLALLAATLLAAAAFAGVGRPEAAHGDAGTSTNAVTTLGHGSITVVPDQATITAGVHTQAATASAALAANATKMNAVIAALKAHGGTNVQTEQVSLSPQTDDNGNVKGYAADNSVSVDSAISATGGLIDAAVAAGANTISGPSLSATDEQAAYRKALGLAVDDARAKANALAAAGGFHVGPVTSVTEESSAPPPPFASATPAKAPSTPVEPGSEEVTADVTVAFAIQ
jgi:uncharacterized protein YggE